MRGSGHAHLRQGRPDSARRARYDNSIVTTTLLLCFERAGQLTKKKRDSARQLLRGRISCWAFRNLRRASRDKFVAIVREKIVHHMTPLRWGTLRRQGILAAGKCDALN